MDSRLITSDVKKETNPFKKNLLIHSEALFHKLTVNSAAFNCKEFVEHLVDNLNECERIPYSTFSSLIYNSDDEIRGIISTNLDKLFDYLFNPNFSKMFSDDRQREMIKKTIIKLWDHYHLANSQIQDLNRDDFYKNFIPEKKDIYNEIKEEGQKLNKELISMIAIFTAMAFLVFGGLNSLSDILNSSIQGVPVLNISIVCLLWGLCIYNMIYLFMYLVSKIIDKNLASRPGSSFILRRHMIYFLGNIILLLMLYICGWFYFIKCDFQGWYTNLQEILGVSAPLLSVYIVLAFAIIIFLIVVLLRFIKSMYRSCRKNHYIKKYGNDIIIDKYAIFDTDGNVIQYL